MLCASAVVISKSAATEVQGDEQARGQLHEVQMLCKPCGVLNVAACHAAFGALSAQMWAVSVGRRVIAATRLGGRMTEMLDRAGPKPPTGCDGRAEKLGYWVACVLPLSTDAQQEVLAATCLLACTCVTACSRVGPQSEAENLNSGRQRTQVKGDCAGVISSAARDSVKWHCSQRCVVVCSCCLRV